MILQALHDYYQRRVKSGDNVMPPEGWIRRGIDYVLVLNESGECVNVETVFTKQKTKTIGLDVMLPAIGKQALKHTNSGKDANLLWDNASFVFGRGKKGALKLESFISTIETWLPDCPDIGVRAVKIFCEKLKDDSGHTDHLLDRFGLVEDFEKRDPVLAFRLMSDGPIYIQDRPAVITAYREAQLSDVSGALYGTCLITGEEEVPITKNEIVIKGVWGAQSSGANLVSFNERAFESYGKRERQGENAPVSQTASSAYTTALNHLLRKDSPQRQGLHRIGIYDKRGMNSKRSRGTPVPLFTNGTGVPVPDCQAYFEGRYWLNSATEHFKMRHS